MSASLRSKGLIVLNVASRGITSLLLPGGRTAHSRFHIPLNPHEGSECNISEGTPLAKLMIECNIIIWDEAPMMHKHCFKALHKTLKDIMKDKDPTNEHIPFGGKTVVYGGDFRQILPVVPKGSRQDIVNATINASTIWKYCTIFRITQNMCLQSLGNVEERVALKEFSEWIASIGDEKVGVPNDEYMNDLNSSEGCTYLSSDSSCKFDAGNDFLNGLYTLEFLNGIKCSGPNHEFHLKVGTPDMWLKNMDYSIGLCNETRLVVTTLSTHVLDAKS